MAVSGIADQLSMALATARATSGQRRIAMAIGIATLVIFLAAVPFVRTPLTPMPAFIPAYQTALFVIDLITAVLLTDQFLRVRSPGLLVLAAGYLFDALIIVFHTLSFPGAFSATGLLGAKAQTTAWLYVFWHGGFAVFVIGYAILNRKVGPQQWIKRHAAWMVAGAIVAVVALVGLLVLLATWGHDLLPVVMRGNDYSMLVSKGVSPAIWLLTLAALLVLWQRDIRVMDLWLTLVMWVWLFDIGLAAVLGSNRFDLGFYAGRLFGLIAAAFLLVALLVEMARMYAGALGAVARAQLTPATAEPVPMRRPLPAARADSTEAFIRDKNIAHYRTLLQSGKLSEAEHRTIEQLLREEERAAGLRRA